MTSFSRRALLLATALALTSPVATSAQTADPAAARVGAFYAALTSTMKAGKELGLQGRIRRLTPAVLAAFNIPAMAQFAVGEPWTRMSASDHNAVANAFARYTISSYARNFDNYSGEKLVVDPNVLTRGKNKLVKTQIVPASGAPTNLNYQLSQSGGTWKIVDVHFNNISQLATQRSDFASSLRSGGAQALVAKLDQLSMKLQ